MLCLFFCVCLFITKIRARGYTIQVTFKWSMLLQLFLDNSRPAMSKTSLDFVFFKIWRIGTFFAFSPLYLSEPLRKQKVVVCDLWLVDFDPFCVFLCFKVLYIVFEKHGKFYLSSKFFLSSLDWNMASLDSQGEIGGFRSVLCVSVFQGSLLCFWKAP